MEPLKQKLDAVPLAIEKRFFQMVLCPGSDDGTHVYFTGVETPWDDAAVYRVKVDDPKSLQRIARLDTLENVVAHPTRNLIAFTDRRAGARYFVKIARKDGSGIKTLSNRVRINSASTKGAALSRCWRRGHRGIRNLVVP